MARAIWTGSICLGLVEIPVSLHAAGKRDELALTMLDRRDFSPVGYERVNRKTGKPVPREEIVEGYENVEGEYVVLTDADFVEANVEATHYLEISDFVDFSAIDPRYIDRPYYLVPQKSGRKAYALLRETLRRTGKAGIGKVVIGTRQHLSAVVASDNALLLILLRFADELRGTSDLDLPERTLTKLGVTAKEIGMAEKLVRGMADEFKPEKYEDEYRRDLMKLIHEKVKAGEINRIPGEVAPKSRPQPTNITELATLLSQSLEKGPRKPKPRPPRGKPPRSDGKKNCA